MEISEFKKYTKNLDAYSASEIEELSSMTVDELEKYQYDLDYDTGNLSTWDNIRAVVTLKKQILELHQKLVKCESSLREIKELVDYREYGDDEIIEMIKEFVREE
jgi:hypothetical protein